ncbi:MAG: DNA-binding protein [Prolixibacteraceae bacterium]|nr:DNA-binding protein [Prolixibacteraceae bacterium]
MKFSEAKTGREFILRLDDGEILHEVIEQFAAEHKIRAARIMLVGGADKGSKLVVGPRESRASKIEPMEIVIDDAHETTGVGTLFLNEEGKPVSHIHLSCGRGSKVITGCARRGVKVWLVFEVVITELVGTEARRVKDHNGFELLSV